MIFKSFWKYNAEQFGQLSMYAGIKKLRMVLNAVQGPIQFSLRLCTLREILFKATRLRKMYRFISPFEILSSAK